MATRRPRRSLVVLVGSEHSEGRFARTLSQSLQDLGVEVAYLGEEDDATRIAAAAAAQHADAVELCIAGVRGVPLLRELLSELADLGRRDVSIVVHRVDARGG